MIRFEVLGPLQVSVDGRSTAVGPPQQQKLLALLLTSPNRAITTDRIIEEMWPRDPPPSARHLVHVYVSRLRELLGEGEHEPRIVRDGSGYALSAHPEEIDAAVLEAGIGEADDLRRTEPSAAARLLQRTTALWRGRPFGDLAFESPVLTAESGRLEELYLEAMAERIGLDLELGDHREVILQLEQLTAQHPYREAFWAHLMLALYRCGRQAEALQTYQTLRRTLVEELGIEPGPDLEELETRILVHDPDLLWEPPPPPSNVPRRLTSFVGRDEEIAAVTKLLESSRLVTLTGSGGIGKTRLAMEVARLAHHRFPDGVWWVDLAPLDDPATVTAAIAATLGVSAQPGADLIESVVNSLVHRGALLVADNCEHVAAGVGDVVSTILRRSGEMTVLATSRVPLHVTGETLWTVPTLDLPRPDDIDSSAVAVSDAVRLFIARGVEVDPGFGLTPRNTSAVVEICHRLDGLPLAIEMASARLRVLSPPQIASSLTDRLAVLARPEHDTDPRHRTLTATFDWSYDLLAPELRAVFDRLSVFASDFDLDAARAVACRDASDRSALDAIGALTEASMITVTSTEPPVARYRLLETTRAYGAAHLRAANDIEETREAHAGHFLAVLTGAEEAIGSPEFSTWTRRIAGSYDDVRLALDWSLSHHPRARTLEVAPTLYNYWYRSGDAREPGRWGPRMLAGADDAHPAHLAAAHQVSAFGETIIGDPEIARRHADAAIDLYERAGDRHGLVSALYGRGSIALRVGDFATVRSSAEQALAVCDDIDDRWRRAEPLSLLGFAELMGGGSLNEARRLTEEALDLYRELGDVGSQVVMNPLSAIALRQGDIEAAERLAVDTAAIAADTGWEATALVNLAEVLMAKGETTGAAATLRRAVTRALDSGLENWFRIALRDLAMLAVQGGQPARAARLMGASRRNMPHYGLDPEMYQSIESGCRAVLDEETVAREATAGERLEHAEIVQFLLA